MRLKSEARLQKPTAFHSSVVGATRHAPYQMNMESIFNFADTLVSKSEAEDHTRRGWLVACDAEKQRGEPPARLEDCVSMQASR